MSYSIFESQLFWSTLVLNELAKMEFKYLEFVLAILY